MDYTTHYNGKGGLAFTVTNPPAAGTPMKTKEGESVVFDEISFGGMVACTRQIDNRQCLYFPHDLVVDQHVEKSRTAGLVKVAEALELLMISQQVLHKVFFMGGGDMAEAAHAVARLQATVDELRAVIGPSLVDLHRIDLLATSQRRAG